MSDYTVPDPDEAVRASDTERDDALHVLAAHYADGRLERAEFDERAEAALAARTRDQLRTLFTDLPGPVPVPATESVPATRAATAPDARRRGAVAPRNPPIFLVPVLLVFAMLAMLHGHPPFPIIPLVFILIRRNPRWNRWNREAPPWT